MPSVSISVTLCKAFDFIIAWSLQLENWVKGRNIIGKSNAVAKWSFLEVIKNSQAKSVISNGIPSQLCSAASEHGNTLERPDPDRVHLQATVQQCTLGDLISFKGIVPTCEFKPALMTFANLGPQFPIETGKLEADVLPRTMCLDVISLQLVTKTSFLLV